MKEKIKSSEKIWRKLKLNNVDYDGLYSLEVFGDTSDENEFAEQLNANDTNIEVHNEKSIKSESHEKLTFDNESECENRNSESKTNLIGDKELSSSPWFNLGLSTEVISILQQKNFKSPTLVQSEALPKALSGRANMIISAETGSGKTLVYILSIIKKILQIKYTCENVGRPTKNCLRSLILTPTRELAIQVNKCFMDISEPLAIRSTLIIGGLSQKKQQRLLKRNPEVIVATPGRLWSIISEESDDVGINFIKDLKGLQLLIIDEVDRMLEGGHFSELENICETVRSQGNPKVYLLSATISSFNTSKTIKNDNETRKRSLKTGKTLKNTMNSSSCNELNKDQQKIMDALKFDPEKAVIIDVKNKFVTPQNLQKFRIFATDLIEKDLSLLLFLKQNTGKTLIFCNTIQTLKRLCKMLELYKMKPLYIHSMRRQKQRIQALEKFSLYVEENSSKSSLLFDNCKVMVTTDVAARGLDIPNIDNVIHYDVPTNLDSYIHRSGRTARYFKPGKSIVFVLPFEIDKYRRILQILNREEDLPKYTFENLEYSELKKFNSEIKLVSEIVNLELQLINSENEVNWFKKKSKEIDTELDPSHCTAISKKSMEDTNSLRRKIKELKRRFSSHITRKS